MNDPASFYCAELKPINRAIALVPWALGCVRGRRDACFSYTFEEAYGAEIEDWGGAVKEVVANGVDERRFFDVGGGEINQIARKSTYYGIGRGAGDEADQLLKVEDGGCSTDCSGGNRGVAGRGGVGGAGVVLGATAEGYGF